MKSVFFFLSAVQLVFANPSSIEMNCPPDKVIENIPWKNRIRRVALENLDEFLNWSLRDTLRTYKLQELSSIQTYHDTVRDMREFACLHDYFSLFRPLVGKVSDSREDVESVRACLLMIDQKITHPDLKKLATAEILAKVLAYRDLQVGDLFSFSTLNREGQDVLGHYRVAHILNLWHGMPAFGLIPLGEGSPILLFRGTDFSLDSQRGWASLMSDIDPGGSGLFTFEKARAEISRWLTKVFQKYGKARVMGFSLGGTLAAYTFIFENEWISEERSFGFNLPGVSEKVIREWNSLPEERKSFFISYVNRGDAVSKVGNLFGTVEEFSLEHPLKPVSAHTCLISAQKTFFQSLVDVEKENQSRR